MLRPGGVLLLTVPFGKYKDYGWFQEFDRTLLSIAIEAFGPAQSARETFYRYTPGGWQVATDQECAECTYAQNSVAAGSVACVRLLKSENVDQAESQDSTVD